MIEETNNTQTNPWETPNPSFSSPNWDLTTDDNNKSSWEENAIESSNEPSFPLIDPITKQLTEANVPFVSEVEEFNQKFNKPNNYIPTIGEEKDWKFVYDFILEELEEYKEACEKGDIIGVLDALCDITYVSLGNGTMLHGLKNKIWLAYKEIQLSNISKACKTPQEALDTVKACTEKFGEECHVEKVNDMYIVYRSRDRKVMKNVNYFPPNLNQFFSEEEILNAPLPIASLKRSAKNELPTVKEVGLLDKPEITRVNLEDLKQNDSISTHTTEFDTEDYW